MRITLFLLLLTLSFLSCKRELPKTITPFNFLIGDWELTNQPDGRVTKEHWRTINTLELRGHGYTLVGNDTAFSEQMILKKEGENWLLKISGPHETPTIFEVTEHHTNSFIAENPTNEFPKKIKYSYFDEVLTARISSDSSNISFIFWRVED